MINAKSDAEIPYPSRSARAGQQSDRPLVPHDPMRFHFVIAGVLAGGCCLGGALVVSTVVAYVDAYHLTTDFDALKFRTPAMLFEFQFQVWLLVDLVMTFIFVITHLFLCWAWDLPGPRSTRAIWLPPFLSGIALALLPLLSWILLRSAGFPWLVAIGPVVAAFVVSKLRNNRRARAPTD
ncbi:MAG: hypothetical protein CMJ48_04870 [Planctomycetaceae bacterium]|nr:hypothetical protein [Planctomycetaceae bacterium]